MALEDVKAFYTRLNVDSNFYNQLQATKSKTECTQVVKAAGYNFTPQEFEEYTSQLLALRSNDGLLQDINEQGLERIVGGAYSFIQGGIALPPYGHSPELYNVRLD